MRLGFDVELHDWKPYRKQRKYTIYSCRKCECGLEEVKHNGPMGDDRWWDIKIPFRYDWEQQWFDEAVGVSE